MKKPPFFAFLCALITALNFDIHAYHAFVVNRNDSTVSVIDTTINTVIAIIPGFSTPNYDAATPNGAFVWVTNHGGNSISIIDTISNTISSVIPLSFTPVDIAITGTTAYVSDEVQHVYAIDTSSHLITATITVGSGPNAVAINPSGTFAYVNNSTSNSISVIDTTNNTVTQTFSVGPNPLWLAVGDTVFGTQIYLTYSNNTVAVINASSGLITATIAASAFEVGISPNGSYAYVTGNFSNTVEAISTSTSPPSIIATIGVGSGPFSVAFTPDNAYAYVSNAGSNNVSVINVTNNNVISLIPVGTNPEGIAITAVPPPPPPPPPPPSPAPSGPINLSAKQFKDDIGIRYELFNRLRWQAGTAQGTPVAGYIIYRNGVEVKTVGPNTFTFEDHNLKKGEAITYGVASFDAFGTQSAVATIVIK